MFCRPGLAVYGLLYATAVSGKDAMFAALGFICTMSFLFAAKIVNVAGYPLVPSAPILAMIFYSSNILQEFHSARDARNVLWINLGAMLGFGALGWLVRLMPAFSADDVLAQAYDGVLDFFPQAVGAALVAFSSSYTINFLLNKGLHKIWGTRLFALRSFFTVSVSNLWDIGVFVALAYPWTDASAGTILATWLVRQVCLAAGIPVLWAIKSRLLKQRVIVAAHG